ncbi:hypothetical protein LMG28614_04706 [Paraburkholderia ultramafica]|uniref:Uncharacterized protein n=1 Tax=Paraburkholderia ultramafica TaxID=1544867 RepID=A0A6S7BFW4_9BURK|nr:hypothetical protein [Paraburkholderia ultramafica]CAB3798186.1 hypothetical protein LMG28614_04706 [Paraburkholderia ultramafica]
MILEVFTFRRIVALLAALLTVALVPSISAAQSVLAPPAAEPVGRNPLVKAVSGIGVRQCLPALSDLVTIGARDAVNSDLLLDWDRAHPDKGAVFSLVGLQYGQSNAAMSIAAVPGADGNCSVAAERVEFLPQACVQVAQHELRGYQATQLLARMTVYTTPRDAGSTVSLIDASPGCLAIRRYVKVTQTVTSSGAAR